MKYSFYNTFIPYRDKFALYNTFEQKVIFIEEGLKDLLNNKSCDEIKIIHPEFFNYLFDNNFILNSKEDELEKVKKLSKKIDGDLTTFMLIVNPTMNCNFKCWYCYESHIKSSRMKESEINKIKLLIDKITFEKELINFNLYFFGGEPLLYFDKIVVSLIDYCSELCEKRNKNLHISFTTNGFLINKSFINYFKSRNKTCHLQITFDGYGEEHDKVRYVNKTKGSYYQIVDNIKLLINNQFRVTARVNYTDENIADTGKIADDFKDVNPEIIEKYLRFDFHRVWQNDNGKEISKILAYELQSMKEKGIKTACIRTVNNVLDSCYADKRNSVVVNFNGDIFKCTARDFSSNNRVGYLSNNGELIWKDNHLEERMNSKFRNAPCLKCELLPICNGGCSQHAIEHLKKNEEYCIYGGKEEKDKVLLAKIDEIVENIQ
ncbi:uncharacterized protein Ga0061079_104137 [Apibacter mensalis]|uniref:Radical SAM core domain-containing protein n=1 Tax=Apibacter mensalis TaxID=1586267 RepID=A0A0X3AQ74_9FLAO|nr:radical SAM protein [Apibacter mensalis]CVK16018.1 uncharacterized protein Ga0061079_104137 [Apibacter mensalis]